MRLSLFALFVSIALSASSQAWAEAPFVFPLNCELGIGCTVLRYQDTQERLGDIADPACGKRTSDNQIGTYFAVPNMHALAQGVAVRAIANGTVELAQDGAPNKPGGDCGNGLRIRHAGGWKSTYCGLLRGSVGARKGQRVKAGQEIGMAGFSGSLPAPGLAFTLERYGRSYDLWTGKARSAGCGKLTPLITGLRYEPLGVIQSGLNFAPPSAAALLQGVRPLDRLPPNAPIVLWAQLAGLEKGDAVVFTIGQNGREIWRSAGAVNPNSPLLYGRKMPPQPGWFPGPLTGKIVVTRGGKTIASMLHTVFVSSTR